MLKRFWHKFDILFPDYDIFSHKLNLPQKAILFIALSIIFSALGQLIPADGFFGFDWVHFFGVKNVPVFYPPWTEIVVHHLNYPLLIGITLSAYSLATYQRSIHSLSMAISFLCLPLLWTIFLGQLEGLVVLGMIGLPLLVPFALLKPQVSIFGFGARRSYLIGFLLFFVVSLLVWDSWIVKTLAVESFYGEGRYEQNIGLGWWGLPIFLLTIWFSRGDMDMLMASGAFISPHIILYNLLPLTPAVARLKPLAAVVAFFLSFLTLSSNWLGEKGWWLGWLFVAWIWINLAAKRYPEWRISRWVQRVG